MRTPPSGTSLDSGGDSAEVARKMHGRTGEAEDSRSGCSGALSPQMKAAEGKSKAAAHVQQRGACRSRSRTQSHTGDPSISWRGRRADSVDPQDRGTPRRRSIEENGVGRSSGAAAHVPRRRERQERIPEHGTTQMTEHRPGESAGTGQGSLDTGTLRRCKLSLRAAGTDTEETSQKRAAGTGRSISRGEQVRMSLLN